jgi:Bromodomain/HMG (high mobility group) box
LHEKSVSQDFIPLDVYETKILTTIFHTAVVNDDWSEDEDVDFTTVPIERLRSILNKEGSYFPVVEGSDNPYRDGYITEPPKKPRGSYLIFQCAMRTYYQKKNPQANLQSELMTALGDAWRKMSDEEKAKFVELANEESKQYEIEKVLLEKAQKPNGVWQPLRRCRMVLDRICSDSFAEVFLDPVNTKEFPEYNDIIDQPMDLATVRKRLETKKYLACEQFARDMRKVRRYVL